MLVATSAGGAEWLPIQALAGGQLELDSRGGSTWGAHLAVNLTVGQRDDERWARFLGLGLAGFLGGTDAPTCAGLVRCAERRSGALFVRAGRALFEARSEASALPLLYWFAQVDGLVGSEGLPGGAPGISAFFGGVRASLGLNALGWTRGALRAATEGDSPRAADFLYVLGFLVALLNHVELTMEWTTPAISRGEIRFGLIFGAGV